MVPSVAQATGAPPGPPHTSPPPRCGCRLARAECVRGTTSPSLPPFGKWADFALGDPAEAWLLRWVGRVGRSHWFAASASAAGGLTAIDPITLRRCSAPAGDGTTDGGGTRQPCASLKEQRANDSLHGRQSPGMHCRENQPSTLFIGISKQRGPKLSDPAVILAGSVKRTKLTSGKEALRNAAGRGIRRSEGSGRR